MSRLPKIFFSYSIKKSVRPDVVQRVIHVTKSAIKAKGWEVIDPMEEFGNEGIREKVEAALRTSDACIVECTASVPNVMFETGFCRSLGYPIIFLVSPDARTDEKLRPYFEFIGLDRHRTLPSDLGDIEYLTYPSDTRIPADWAGFEQRLEESINFLENTLSPEARMVRENVKQFMHQTLRVLRRHPRQHPLLWFLGGWHSQLISELVNGGESVFEIDAVYYKRCIAAFREAGAQNIRAIADLSDMTEEWWRHQSAPLNVSERIFLVDWEVFFDVSRFAKLMQLLQDQSKEYNVRVGSIDKNIPHPHPFGEAAQGHHLLLMEPDLVGGYIKREGRKYLRIDRNKDRYREACDLYSHIQERTLKVEPNWTEGYLRSKWMEKQDIGLWNPHWGRAANRGPDYTDKYDQHIRAWIPDYDKLIKHCISISQAEIARQLREAKGNIGILEVGFGTGAITLPLLSWIETLNKPFRELQGKILVDRYVGLDESSTMCSILGGKIPKDAFHPLLCDGTAWDSLHPAVQNNAPYDLICGSLVFHDIIGSIPQQSVDRTLEQASQHLSNGGCLVFADVFTDSNPEKREQQIAYWRNRMLENGLSIKNVELFFDKNLEMINTATFEQLADAAKRYSFLPPELKTVPATNRLWPFKLLIMRKTAEL